jgi:hypothetical protein
MLLLPLRKTLEALLYARHPAHERLPIYNIQQC